MTAQLAPHPSGSLFSGTFSRAGSRIRYWTAGQGDGPAVVLTHGAGVDHGTFAGQLPALVEAGYTVVAWDMRGHGSSQPMGRTFTIEDAADDLAALMDEVGVNEATHVGQSFGGLVIQEFYRRRPDRVRGLVLVGSIALGDRLPFHQRVLQRARPLLLRLWPEGHLRRVYPSFLSRRPEVQRDIARAIEPLSKATMIAVTEAALEGLVRYEPVGPIWVPLLLVRGDQELSMVAGMIDAWAERDAAVRLELVEGAGHLVNQESAGRFNEVLLGFLRAEVSTA